MPDRKRVGGVSGKGKEQSSKRDHREHCSANCHFTGNSGIQSNQTHRRFNLYGLRMNESNCDLQTTRKINGLQGSNTTFLTSRAPIDWPFLATLFLVLDLTPPFPIRPLLSPPKTQHLDPPDLTSLFHHTPLDIDRQHCLDPSRTTTPAELLTPAAAVAVFPRSLPTALAFPSWHQGMFHIRRAQISLSHDLHTPQSRPSSPFRHQS